jgi:hypothetical protein
MLRAMTLKPKTVVVAVLFGSLAFAGQAERDKKKEVEAELPAAKAVFKKSCGCDLAFDIKWDTFKTFGAMRAVHGLVDNFQSYAPEVCKDAEARKAICKMKTISLSFAPLPEGARGNPDPTFDEKTGVMKATTDGMAVPDLGWMAHEILDK